MQGIVNLIKTAQQTYAANATMLAIQYSRSPKANEVITAQPAAPTVQVDADANDSGGLRIILTETVYDQTGTSASTTTNNIDGDVYTTLGDVVDAINALPGWTAWVTDALHSHSTDSSSFTDLAATAVDEAPYHTDFLQRSVATGNNVWLRIGEPTDRDAGRLRLFRVSAEITDYTGGTISIYRDAKGETVDTLYTIPMTANAHTAYIDDKDDNAVTVRGPIVVELDATDNSGAILRVNTQTATNTK